MARKWRFKIFKQPTFSSIPLTSHRDPNLLISLAQFRPEKNHSDQVKAFAILKKNIPNRPIKFVMAGGVRNEGDEKRANDIEALGIGFKKF